MNTFLKMAFGAAVLAGSVGSAVAHESDTHVTQTRVVDAKTARVKIDGVIHLVVRQGDQPKLVLTGDQRWLDRTKTRQDGDTLRIDTESVRGRKGFHISSEDGIHAVLTLPALRSLSSESFGSTDVRGFSGDALDLSLEGAGSMKVVGKYKTVNANLGGFGSMDIDGGDLDAMDLNVRGAGLVTLSGKSRQLKADMGGLGSLDAKGFEAQNVDLDLSGLGNATVNATRAAQLNLTGMGSVTVFGNPASRKVSVDGLGSVSWK